MWLNFDLYIYSLEYFLRTYLKRTLRKKLFKKNVILYSIVERSLMVPREI